LQGQPNCTARRSILKAIAALGLNCSVHTPMWAQNDGSSSAAHSTPRIAPSPAVPIVSSGQAWDMCSGYGDLNNCSGRVRGVLQAEGRQIGPTHDGMDFAASPGTQVVVPTWGEFIATFHHENAGGTFVMKTTGRISSPEIYGGEGECYLVLAHIEPTNKYNVMKGENPRRRIYLRPGDECGVIPSARPAWAFQTDHVHLGLLLSRWNFATHMDPTKYFGERIIDIDRSSLPEKVPMGPLRLFAPFLRQAA